MNCSTVDPTCAVFPSTNLTAYGNTPVTALTVCVLTFSFLFGFPTHCYVLWLIFTGAENGVASEFFNLNLSVCEIIFSVYTLLFFFSVKQSLHESVLLLVLRFLTEKIITTRPLFQCLMCVERYLAVVHPVTFLKYKPLRYRVICCTVVWIIGLGVCFFCLFILGSSPKLLCGFHSLQFLLLSSSSVVLSCGCSQSSEAVRPGERGRERGGKSSKERAFKIIVILTVTMLIMVVPFTISRFLYILLQKDIEEVSFISFFCFALGSFVPALLYLWRVGKLPSFCA